MVPEVDESAYRGYRCRRRRCSRLNVDAAEVRDHDDAGRRTGRTITAPGRIASEANDEGGEEREGSY